LVTIVAHAEESILSCRVLPNFVFDIFKGPDEDSTSKVEDVIMHQEIWILRPPVRGPHVEPHFGSTAAKRELHETEWVSTRCQLIGR
jgi:hypothetical protein